MMRKKSRHNGSGVELQVDLRELDEAYEEMGKDEAAGKEAVEWSEALIEDLVNDPD